MTMTVAEHIAMEGVAPFELADEVTLSSGKRLRGSFARVYSLLRGTADRQMAHRIGSKIGPAGWVPGYYLRRAWSGGNAGDRRVRGLRTDFGVTIDRQRFGEGEEEESNTYLYRWVSDPEPGTAGKPEQPNRSPEASHRNPPTGSTLANERVSEPSATLRPPLTPPAPRIHPVHGRLTFFTCVGNPGSGAPGPVNLAPHFRHCLAPSSQLMSGVVRGQVPGEKAAAAYREELATRWAQGDFRFWFEENLGKVLTLWTSPECAAAFNPLPLVAAILVKCGADHLGEWQQNQSKRGAA